ncbi:longitudinals lacking protein-like protein [Leptotrombidium deliense]|uniref:Longitudinals lacking protein-like protein n=1 Tax=Leptotrombidium deliense TaxID=299467 RepID=A0A443SVZ6_9ACAR|nr:longitudinals lacking protein-like protein [Leptotrombidium deliense]
MEFKNQVAHREAIASTFLNMFKNQQNCDVSLVVDGRMMKAHKRILSVFSTFFKDIFEEQEANSSIASNIGANVAFLNYKYDHVEAIIKYMYTGIIRVSSKDDWPAVVKCAQDLGIMAIVDYSKSLETKNSGESKRKLEELRKEVKPNGTETKRSKSEVEKVITAEQRKPSKNMDSSSNDLDLVSDVSFDHSSKKGDTTLVIGSSNSSSNTQITKIQKVSKGSEFNSKSSDSSKKEVNSYQPAKKLIPTSSSTPKPENRDDRDKDKKQRSRSSSEDSDPGFSLSNKTKSFGEKVKKLESGVTFKESHDKKAEAILKQDSTGGRKEDVVSTKKCSKCGITYSASSSHLLKSELPTPPAMCPVSGCDKMMKMNRMLMDHLTKFHKVTFCEEK